MPGYEKISKKTMVCATCDLWQSEDRRPVHDLLEIEYEVYQRAECGGTINSQQSMTPLSRCREWRMWKKMNMPRLKPMESKEDFHKTRSLTRIEKAKAFLRSKGIKTTEAKPAKKEVKKEE